jgi:hypothetical protein
MLLSFWLRRLRARFGLSIARRKDRAAAGKRGAVARLCLEALEDRTVPSTFAVTNTSDDANLVGSLRWAINQVNADSADSAAQPDTISFDITAASNAAAGLTTGFNAGTGVATIQPQSALPAINNPVIINGYSQPGASANNQTIMGPGAGNNAGLTITLDGSNISSQVDGLAIAAGNSTVQGLVIQNFYNDIHLMTNGNDTIAGNDLGSDSADSSNTGVFVDNVAINTIGGVTPGALNVVGGQTGILMQGAGATGNYVDGDYIGTDGSQLLNSGFFGVIIQDGSDNNVVGGTAPGAGNVISPLGWGIWLDFDGGVPVSGNLIQGNYIGPNAAGDAEPTGVVGGQGLGFYKRFEGVTISNGSSDNTIGGATSSARNVISGWAYQVRINNPVGAPEPTGNVVEENYIGTTADGSAVLGPVASHGDGVIQGPGVGNTTISGNLISGVGTAVVLDGSGTLVQGNLIGTNAAATGSIPNAVGIQDFGNNNLIGGTAPVDDNTIGNSSALGVREAGTGGAIEGNSIYGNAGPGVEISGTGNSIDGNSIYANTGPGVWVQSDPFGSADPFGSFSDGVATSDSIEGNSIYGNGGLGIALGSIAVDVNGNPLTLSQVQASVQSNPGLWDHDEPSSTVVFNDEVFVDNLQHDGGNNDQNFPVLNSASSSTTSTFISGTFSEAAEPDETLTLDFYANTSADPTGYGQGQTYLGSRTIDTDASGNASFNADFAVGNLTTDWISATATDQKGDTSEFSLDVQATSAPGQTFAQNLASSLPQSFVGSNTLTIQADPSTINDVVSGLSTNNLGASVVPVSVYLNLVPGTYQSQTIQVPQGMTLYINGQQGTTIDPVSPALTMVSGNVIISNVTFVTTGDSPTILVTGGHLTLRNDTIQDSTGYNEPAISVTGGTVDLGMATDPGGNTINVNGSGTWISNTTASPVSAIGDTFKINGQTTTWPVALTVNISNSLMLVGKSPPPLTGTVNGTPFTGSTTYTTALGDTVTVTLSTAATSGSAVGQYPIMASLSGPDAGNYTINPATPTVGTMYVVSLGADPSSTTGAQAVTFWDNKGNEAVITAAELASLDALNLVNQGGADFDPHSVAQLQAWLSTSPNSATSYQLAVQLAVMDLNVLGGYVHATDLVYAGALLPFTTTYGITGLTSGGFIDVQDLMNAANAILGQVSPGNPSGDPNQAYEAALDQVLQAANLNSDFVVGL